MPETFKEFVNKRKLFDQYMKNHKKWNEFKSLAEVLYEFIETSYGFTEIIRKPGIGKNFGTSQEEKDKVADFWEFRSEEYGCDWPNMKQYSIWMADRFGTFRDADYQINPILPDLDKDHFQKAGFPSSTQYHYHLFHEMLAEMKNQKFNKKSAESRKKKKQSFVKNLEPIIEEARSKGCESYRDFGNFFEEKGHKTSTGKKKWYPSTVKSVLEPIDNKK